MTSISKHKLEIKKLDRSIRYYKQPKIKVHRTYVQLSDVKMNFFQNLLYINCEDYFIIPPHWGGQLHFYSFTFEGWKFSLDHTDPSLNEVMSLCRSYTDDFAQAYKETHAFTQPQISIKMNGAVEVKIGTMELDQYHQMMERNKSAP